MGNDDDGDSLPLSDEQDRSDVDGVGGFAADFYRSGADWSRLLPAFQSSEEGEEEEEPRITSPDGAKGRRLKQANLFQMWGFRNPNTNDDNTLSHNESSSSDCPPPMSFRKKRRATAVPGLHQPISCGGGGGGGSGLHDNLPRPCPFYKKLPGTPFSVDAFRYGSIEGCLGYFLSHFHSDHYGGLTKGWSYGPIYCTPLTARLLRICLYVNSSFIHPLELDTEYVIEGIKITMLEANHCPGASLIHFRLPNGQSYLHTGDFRACKSMQAYPLLSRQRINVLYLDTTYCNPKYKFPSKEDVLSFVVRVTTNCLKRQPRTLIIVGAYSIGKECVYLAISEALGVKIFTNASRRRILQSFGWPSLSKRLCFHGKDTPLHVLPISSLRFESLKQYLNTYKDQYAGVLAFRPTGWTYSETIGNQLDLIKPTCRGNITIYGVPYSEHSSFTELQEFVQFLRPEKIIPTVNVGNVVNRGKMQSYFRDWLMATYH